MMDFQLLSINDLNKNISEPFLTDFAILTGAAPRSKTSSDKGGYWWLKELDKNNSQVQCVDPDGKIIGLHAGSTICGVRPVINYSLIRPYCKSLMNTEKEKIVICGEYPKSIVTGSLAYKLEKDYNKGIMIPINQSFRTCKEFDNRKNYTFIRNKVYSYNSKKYIRYEADTTFYEKCFSSGIEIIKGNPYWVLVEPLQWIVDVEKNIAITRDLIISGIPFDDIGLNHSSREFPFSFLKMFLYLYFTDDIITKDVLSSNFEDNDQENKYDNCYKFDLSKVNEEDIIRGMIESDISLFLHGKPSDGKSTRIKKIDPDCEIIYMRNATPESLNGKSVYDASTGSMIDIPPSWYKNVVDKCNKEVDKLHIVFFDELTNALPSMQGMAFNIILDKEVNGKWKLPNNARIVAAGNDLEDSLAANKMAEPLFNRFAHVYINTTVEDWLEWAIEEDSNQRLDYEVFEQKEKIHPAIISYIESRYKEGFDALRTSFDGEKPNADPRKWEMASKVLYKTNKPEMLRSLIGEQLTKDFVSYIIRSSRRKIKKL